MVTITVAAVDLPVVVQVGISPFNGTPCLKVVKLMIQIKHIRLVSFAQNLKIVTVDGGTNKCVGG